MKISVKNLKRVIKESLTYLSRAGASAAIRKMAPDEVATDDYVDEETGEIVLEKGKAARTSSLHPQYAVDHSETQARRKAEEDAEDAQYAEEDDEWEAELASQREKAEKEYVAAIRAYASNWTHHKYEYNVFDEDEDLQSTATDAAQGFFHEYPEWKHWAAQLDLTKDDMSSAVSEFVYEAIITGKVP